MLGVRVSEMGIVHEDGRRMIGETELPQVFGLLRVTWIFVNGTEPQRLGDHHHDVMMELFQLAYGTIERLVVSRDGEFEFYECIKAPALITMPTGVDHTLVMAPGSVLNSFCEMLFDPKDMIPATDAHKAAVA